jgi:hypothetical protein
MSDRLWWEVGGVTLLLFGCLSIAEAQTTNPSRAMDQPSAVTGPALQRTPAPTRPATPQRTPGMRSGPVPEPSQPRPSRRGARPGGLIVLWPFDQVISPVVPIVALPIPDTGLRGGVQLDVQPWRAEVFVDGIYAGLVEDFSGYYRHLDVVAGPHVITIVAPDHEPLVFEVMVSPGRTITHRATLSRAPGR